jgi:hypothetical protein
MLTKIQLVSCQSLPPELQLQHGDVNRRAAVLEQALQGRLLFGGLADGRRVEDEVIQRRENAR